MKKMMILIWLLTSHLMANELYGMGKIVEVHDSQVSETMGYKYFLVVKKGTQVGALPIQINSPEDFKRIAGLKDQFVIFKGKTIEKKVGHGEGHIETELIAFSDIKRLDLASLRPVMDKFPEPKRQERTFDLSEPGPTQMNISMDNQVTQAIILTGAALLLNSQMDPGGRGVVPYQDINKGIILTAGVLMVADRLSRALKIDFGHWNIKK